MKKTIIIGGNGNIGFAVANYFKEAGHAVTCYNRGLSGAIPEGVELIVGDRRDHNHFKRIMGQTPYDVAIDLTCYNRDEALKSIQAFSHVGHLVHCSSVATYGRNLEKLPADEQTPIKPGNDYGRGKAEADEVIMDAYVKLGLPATIIKPAICFGPKFGLLRQLGQDLSWLSRIHAGKPLLVADDGSAVHQFMHVNDVAEAIYRITQSKNVIGEIFNVANPQTISWNDYHQTAMKAIGRSVELIGAPPKLIFSECARLGHPISDILSHNSHFSDNKLRDATGFVPRISLLDGMKNVLEELERSGRLPQIIEGNWEDQIIKRITGNTVR